MSDNILPNLDGLVLVHVDEEHTARAACILDTAANIHDSNGDANTSYSAAFPAMFQVDPVPAGTTVEVQAKVHKDAQWIKLWESSVGTPAYIQQWSMPFNFVRAVRTSGTGAVKAFYAMYTPDSLS